jgi:hypothetical protein
MNMHTCLEAREMKDMNFFFFFFLGHNIHCNAMHFFGERGGGTMSCIFCFWGTLLRTHFLWDKFFFFFGKLWVKFGIYTNLGNILIRLGTRMGPVIWTNLTWFGNSSKQFGEIEV